MFSFPQKIFRRLLDRMVALFLIFWRNLHTVSRVAVSIYIPTNTPQVFPFFHVLANSYFLSFSFFAFLGLQVQHMEVPRLGAESELQFLAYSTTTATRDLASSVTYTTAHWQHQILNLSSQFRNRIVMDTRSGSLPLSYNGNTSSLIFLMTAILTVKRRYLTWFWFKFPWWSVTSGSFSCSTLVSFICSFCLFGKLFYLSFNSEEQVFQVEYSWWQVFFSF